MAAGVLQFTSLNTISSPDFSKASANTSSILGSQLRILEINRTRLRSTDLFQRSIPFTINPAHGKLDSGLKRDSALKLKAALREPIGLSREIPNDKKIGVRLTEKECDLFSQMKHRFLSFKKHTYLDNLEHYQNLATAQSPKFMLVACADSRVCPSSILGFQPGEAFVIRNVANLVPPSQNGPTETNAALEFAVNSLEVENIMVIGHSCCGGIKALMSMQDDDTSSSFISKWVTIGKPARMKTEAAASSMEFDQQCRHCEKESINRSLSNLLTYPWIYERVRKGLVAIHGGYYDFINCTFEKWTLDYERSQAKVNGEYTVKDHEFWQ